MKKAEAETALKHLFGEWQNECDIRPKPQDDYRSFHPSFSEFKLWLNNKGYGHYLRFRSVMGPDFDAELWFDQYFNQTWRR